jgi:hypothetical protein
MDEVHVSSLYIFAESSLKRERAYNRLCLMLKSLRHAPSFEILLHISTVTEWFIGTMLTFEAVCSDEQRRGLDQQRVTAYCLQKKLQRRYILRIFALTVQCANLDINMNKDLPDPVSLFESITDTWTDCFTTAYLFSKTQSKRAEACNLRTDNLRPICLPLSSLSLAR